MSENTLNYLRHYTSLEGLYNILDSQTLRFGYPQEWLDKNDAAVLRAFCKKKGVAQARVICLATDIELVHHWNTYAPEGCRIEFKKNKFIEEINKHGFLCNSVNYYPSEKLTKEFLQEKTADELPFIKRRPYECEKEYRIIWCGKAAEHAPEINIKDCIDSITLSPKIPSSKVEAIKYVLETKYHIKTIKRSRLLHSDEWISKFDNLK
jgi:hypothetical protein